MLPSFATAARLRPVALLAPDLVQVRLNSPRTASLTACPAIAPSVALEAAGATTLRWSSGDDMLEGRYAGGRVWLRVTTGSRTTEHRSRRFGRTAADPDRVALTLTGTHLTAFTREDGAWVARARADLRGRVETRDEGWLAALHAGHEGPATGLAAGAFGQLGLRDPRIVSHADGTAYTRPGHGGEVLLTATSAGPGFFDTAHTSVWSLATDTLALTHLGDLFFRRPDHRGVYADHATHLVHDGDAWLVATSTWGDFDPDLKDASVGVTLARTDADLLCGQHLLDTEALPLPTDGLASVGVWDPHLVRTDGRWLVGYVSARKFFDFFPVVATGPSLDALTLRAASTQRRATEGTTLLRVGGDWRVIASDGRDNPRPLRTAYPVFDLDLRQLGTLEAEYPTNIPWPTLVETSPGQWLMIGFDGEAYGGRLLGYGTHGTVVIARSR